MALSHLCCNNRFSLMFELVFAVQSFKPFKLIINFHLCLSQSWLQLLSQSNCTINSQLCLNLNLAVRFWIFCIDNRNIITQQSARTVKLQQCTTSYKQAIIFLDIDKKNTYYSFILVVYYLCQAFLKRLILQIQVAIKSVSWTQDLLASTQRPTPFSRPAPRFQFLLYII